MDYDRIYKNLHSYMRIFYVIINYNQFSFDKLKVFFLKQNEIVTSYKSW